MADFFHYQKGELYAEKVRLLDLARRYQTPVYVYSRNALKENYLSLHRAFRKLPHLICYALKANANLSVLKSLAALGCGADIVSGGELFRALQAGISPRKIVYAGVGKTETEIVEAIHAGILLLNVESMAELNEVNRIAGSLKRRVAIGLRVNPDIDPGTHPYISTGLKEHKFGIPISAAAEHYQAAAGLKNVRPVGIHMHLGSQITSVGPFIEGMKKLLNLIDGLVALRLKIRYIDMGGGLGINYGREDRTTDAAALARSLQSLLLSRQIKLILEPGRSISGNAGVLITRVLYRKKGEGKEFLVVDAGMNDLIRPSLYQAFHQIIPVMKNGRGQSVMDVVGPVCETSDFLARGREIEDALPGDLLAVLSAGAYGFSMSSNYNSRRRAAEVMVDGASHYLIRKRETYRDLIAHEMGDQTQRRRRRTER